MSLSDELRRRVPVSWKRAVKRRLADQLARRSIARGQLLVPLAEASATFSQALEELDRLGASSRNYFEFGVGHGTSLVAMRRAAGEHGQHDMLTVGFDSFRGLPAVADTEAGSPWGEGDFSVSERVVRWNLTRQGIDLSKVRLVSGWYEDTLNEDTARTLPVDDVGIIMVDCDLFESARLALRFCGPFIRDTAVIIFDDWHAADLARKGLGERKAFEEFLAANPSLHAWPAHIEPYNANAAIFVVRRS